MPERSFALLLLSELSCSNSRMSIPTSRYSRTHPGRRYHPFSPNAWRPSSRHDSQDKKFAVTNKSNHPCKLKRHPQILPRTSPPFPHHATSVPDIIKHHRLSWSQCRLLYHLPIQAACDERAGHVVFAIQWFLASAADLRGRPIAGVMGR